MINKLPKFSSFTKDVFTLASGTAVAQAIPVAISPILTRLYTPDDFGVFAVYFSVFSIISVLATGKYEMAVIVPRDDHEAYTLLQLCFVITTFVAVAIAVVVVVIYVNELNFVFTTEPITLFLIPVALFGFGISQALYYFTNRNGQYRVLVKGRIVRASVYSAFTCFLGIIRSSGFMLSLSDSVAYLANSIYWFRLFRKEKSRKPIGWSALKEVAVRYINFPKYLIVSGVFEKASGHAPIFFINNLFNSVASAGFFSFSQRMIVTPADLIARAIGDVFRQQASGQYATTGRCDTLFKRTFVKLALIGLFPFTLAYFVVEDVFAFVFGNEWRTAGVYAKIMMPMFYLQFIVSPLSVMFVIAQKQKFDLAMQVCLALLVSASFIMGFYFQSVHLAIVIFAIVYSLKYGVECWLSFHFSKGIL